MVRENGVKRLVRSMHRVIRDCEGDSSIVERFDELTKVLYATFHDEGEGDNVASAGRIRDRYATLVARNPRLFSDPRFHHLKLSAHALSRLAELLGPVPLSAFSQDLKGVAYEEVIQRTFEKGDNQQFFTPRMVVEFMTHMVRDSLQGTVCDPACGTGGFLLGVHEQVRRQRPQASVAYLGFEIDGRLAWATRMNLDMHGCSRFDIRHVAGAGTLEPGLARGVEPVDVVITNPPFGSDLTERRALDAMELGRGRPTRRRGILFLERCLDLLKPGGVLAIVIDDGVLNAPHAQDARKHLLDRAHPFAVVSLPETTFMPYATVKTSILFLQKRGSAAPGLGVAGRTFFGKALRVGKKPNGDPLLRYDPASRRMQVESDLPGIAADYDAACAGQPPSGERAFLADVPSVADPAFTRAGWRLDLPFHHPSRRAALRSIERSPYPVHSLCDLVAFRNEPLVPAVECPDDQINYVGLAHIAARSGVVTPALVYGTSLRSTVKRFGSGDVLFSKMRPELRKAAFVERDAPDGYASAECVVMTPRVDADTGQPLILPELLAILMRSDLVYGQIVHMVIGIGRPRLGKRGLHQIRIPVPPRETQARLLDLYRRSANAAEALVRESESALRRAASMLDGAHDALVADMLASG